VAGSLAPRVRVDGEAIAAVPADDRGFLLGDGVFRTVRIEAGRPWLWAAQMQVLQRDCARIGIDLTASLQQTIETDSLALVAGDDGVLRITVTRGSGPRGQAPPDPARPRVVLSFTPVEPPAFSVEPATLRLCRTPLGWTPATAGIKHMGRLELVMAAAELTDGDPVFDGLLLDPEGRPVCGTRCNLFLRSGRRLRTPAVDRCGVAGVVRGEVLGGGIPGLDRLVDAVEEAGTTLDELEAADEVLVTNALFGVRGVSVLRSADGSPDLHWPAPGPVTECLLAAFAARAGS
jgi:4-amino-4-deoxychorismate lyase